MHYVAAVSARRSFYRPTDIPAPKFDLFQRVYVCTAQRRYRALLCGMTWNSEEATWLYAIGDGSRMATEDCLMDLDAAAEIVCANS